MTAAADRTPLAPEPAVERARVPLRRLPGMVRRPLDALSELAAGRDAVDVQLGPRRALLVNHPRLVRELFELDDARAPLAGLAASTAARLGGASLPGLVGDAHRRRRAIVSAQFSHDAAAPWTGLVAASAERATAGWRPGMVVDAEHEMERATLDAVARVVFGADYEAERPALVELYEVSRRTVLRIVNPLSGLAWRLPLPLTRDYERARAGFEEAVDAMAERRRAHAAREDVLGRLVHARDGDGAALDVATARDEAWTYLSQSAPMHALGWTWWLLGTHPEAEARVHAEVDALAAGEPLTAGDVDRLAYVRGALLEALRLYPPGWLIARPAARRRLIGGHIVEPGTVLLLSPWVIGRDERFWPGAARFRPERWLDGAGAVDPHAFAAFGAGPRRCPARPFAELMCVAVLATVARRWRLRPVRRTAELAYVPFLRPRLGMPVVLQRRGQAA